MLWDPKTPCLYRGSAYIDRADKAGCIPFTFRYISETLLCNRITVPCDVTISTDECWATLLNEQWATLRHFFKWALEQAYIGQERQGGLPFKSLVIKFLPAGAGSESGRCVHTLPDAILSGPLFIHFQNALSMSSSRPKTAEIWDNSAFPSRADPSCRPWVHQSINQSIAAVIQGKYGNLDASVVSYGPCQTPTLNFCVERHQRITAFQSEPYWTLRPISAKNGRE